MELYKWSKKDLLYMRDNGYKIIDCKDEDEVASIRKVLKENKRCAQAGIYYKDDVKKYFVVTKEREVPSGK